MKNAARQAALSAGLKRYASTKRCPRGHLAERFVSTMHCVICAQENAKRWKEANPLSAMAINRTAHAKRMSAAGARIEMSERSRLWSKLNPHKARVQSKLKQARKKCRTPAWADNVAIREVYERAERVQRCTGLKFHVDHVIPLKGRRVSGLHVHDNLRVVPALVNLRKKNTFEVTA